MLNKLLKLFLQNSSSTKTMRINGKRQWKNHDVPSFALIVFSESPCVASLAAVATSRRGHFEKYINFNLSSYKACLRFILINTAGALVVTAVCKGPLVGGIHSIQSIPLPFFAQKPINLFSHIIFVGMIAFLVQSCLNSANSETVSAVEAMWAV